MTGGPGQWSALLIHGAGGGGWEWRIWQGVWQAHGLNVHAPDLQPAPEGLARTGWQHYAAQIRDALAMLPHPRVLVGASLGGLLAASHAGAADALIAVNPLPPAPLHRRLPPRQWPDVVPWGMQARLFSTRQAMPDADDATALFAFRHWRDESGAVMRMAAAGIDVPAPACPVLVIASTRDDDVPPALSREQAAVWQADFLQSPAGSHVGPLLGDSAAGTAAQAVAWVNRLAVAG
ncbi:alpha/beta fold hydrolase [Pseudoxanthomonas wuyuanensis]|uniref:Lysophospholipase, alpha-beta hydrolase superfamily n=1 Tax=Pseudoxanthomonas wuyuanensis TaxID=1073196 RepID=A0A286DD73_9GAMM|nr:alpha/beta fold hydrolase [Pseudoxanthomonas wuyuanensis]SOD56595.1 Lysophospholipase, alpha-beta hydrolase superfamily [Pseudoxanthomonas wuyuanensis]